MIISKAVVVPTLILDLTMALTVGFVLGYGVREWIPAGVGRRSDGDRASAAASGVEPARGAQAALSRTGMLS